MISGLHYGGSKCQLKITRKLSFRFWILTIFSNVLRIWREYLGFLTVFFHKIKLQNNVLITTNDIKTFMNCQNKFVYY